MGNTTANAAAGESPPPLFCPHAVSGSASVYGLLAAKLKDDFALSGIQSAGLHPDVAPHTSIAQMADSYLDALTRNGPLPPVVHISGWSMGGTIGWEMGRKLVARGHRVRLVMVDTQYPRPFERTPADTEFLQWFAEDILGSVGADTGPWEPVENQDEGLARVVELLGLPPSAALVEDFRRRLAVFRSNMRAAFSYRPGPLDADVLIVRAASSDLRPERWRPLLSGDLTVRTVAGTHYDVLGPGAVDEVATLIREHLTADAPPPPAPRPRSGPSPADIAFLELRTRAGIDDPYPSYDVLRRTAPVHPTSYGPVLVTGYAAAAQALRSADLGVDDAAWMDVHEPGWRASPTELVMGQSLLNRNPPEHTRLRRLVNGAFVQRHIHALSGRVERMVAERLDAVAEQGAGGGTVDLHELLAHPLPVSVIADMLGIPASDREWLRGPTSAISVVFDIFTSESDRSLSDEALRTLGPYLEELIEQRRRSPRDDMISALLASHDGTDAFTREELLQLVLLLFIAGFETTVNLLTNGVHALLRHPAELALLRADPGLAAAAVEETVRYESPIQATVRRALRRTTLAGVDVPSGTPVVVFIGAAHRDPEQFDEPNRFRLGRTGAKNMGFGGGIHYCVGSALARLEGEIVFRELFRRFPRLALAGEPVRRPVLNPRGYSSLPVTIG
ncbi:cytochrome P450 [Streptomyces sp. NPDC050732]|uniref:cytochrome P450 n=1 Tax=Streptomyces sp. NPDC050732 TaxID=3154632 RepID=UPI00343943BA